MRSEFATLLPADGDAFLRVQAVDSAPARVHFDLHVDETQRATSLAVRLGARIVGDFGALVVLASPGGLPFCVVTHRGERIRPQPVALGEASGPRSLVDQVCLDIPVDEFEREAGFWSGLTGWEHRPGNTPEFDVLARPEAMPLRLLLQRVGRSGPVSAHLDLACEDVELVVAQHQTLGASVAWRGPRWVTMRDPAGRLYCATSRDPATGRITD